jgi:hypothetical protein
MHASQDAIRTEATKSRKIDQILFYKSSQSTALILE